MMERQKNERPLKTIQGPKKDNTSISIWYFILIFPFLFACQILFDAVVDFYLDKILVSLLIFAIMGILIYAAIAHKWLTPRPKTNFYLSDPLTPGSTTTLRWNTFGDKEDLQKMQISVIGFERAERVRHSSDGEERHTQTAVFYEQFLGDFNGEQMHLGEVSITIPAEGLPSFAAKKNEIRWVIRLKYSLKWRLGIKEHYQLPVHPIMPKAYRAKMEAAAQKEADTLPEELAIVSEHKDKQPAPVKSLMNVLYDHIQAEHVRAAQNLTGHDIQKRWITLPGTGIITFDERRTAYAPGELIRGTFGWQLKESVAAIDLRLVWFTKGKGNPEKKVVALSTIEHPTLQGTNHFEFQAPFWPYSFDGKLVSVVWRLDMVARPFSDQRQSRKQKPANAKAIKLIRISPQLKKLTVKRLSPEPMMFV